MRHWNKNPLAASSNWSCFPPRYKVKNLPACYTRKHFPKQHSPTSWRVPTDITVTWQRHSSILLTSFHSLVPPSTSSPLSDSQNCCFVVRWIAQTEIVKRPHKTSEALRMQSHILPSATVTRRNSLCSSSRYNQELYLYLFCKHGGDCAMAGLDKPHDWCTIKALLRYVTVVKHLMPTALPVIPLRKQGHIFLEI